MGLLGVLSAVALLVGGVQTTMILSEGDRMAAEESKTPVVEVQPVETDRGDRNTRDTDRESVF